MADLTRVDAAQAVEITDGISLTATVNTGTPAITDAGLVTRNIAGFTSIGPTSLNTSGATVVMNCSGLVELAVAVVGTQASGTYAAVFETSLDGTTWFSVYGFSSSQQIMVNTTSTTTTSISDLLTFHVSAMYQFRIRCTSIGTTPSITVNIRGVSTAAPKRIAAYQANGPTLLPLLSENQPTNAAVDLNGALYVTDKPRNIFALTSDMAAFATTEALISFTKNLGGTQTTSVTSHTVTTGKILRITSVSIAYNLASTTISNMPKFRLRAITSGTLSASSNVIWMTNMNSPSGTGAAGEGQVVNFNFGDGIDFASGWVVGFSQIMPTAAAGSYTMSVTGYES